MYTYIYEVCAFQFLTKKIDDAVVVAKVYYSAILLFVLLMNTFIYCGAGELVTERVSYTTCVCIYSKHK